VINQDTLNNQLRAAAKVAYESGYKHAFRVCIKLRQARLKNTPAATTAKGV
jgi:hypothetical protein